ncbi:CLUMA_CG015590, isoform A [Clunio marinus]|uniref:CLUMA_CG015590, isoform A n=1 Tax=Clunio marinus TaxID=568069 RepID=A0A1J1IPB3_9DIPT|nr:CLUMA_CG015590, isoform A [Clunio marinus]
MELLKLLSLFVFLFTFLLQIFCKPLQENMNCNFSGCEGLNFVCASNGYEYQYFRNICYLRNFNHCNRQNFRVVTGDYTRGCIAYP